MKTKNSKKARHHTTGLDTLSSTSSVSLLGIVVAFPMATRQAGVDRSEKATNGSARACNGNGGNA